MRIRTEARRGPCFDKYEIARLQDAISPPVTTFYRLLQLRAPWELGDDATVHALVTGEGIKYKEGQTYYVRETLLRRYATARAADVVYEADREPAVDEGSRLIPWAFRGVARVKARDMPSGFARYAVTIRRATVVQLADVTDEMAVTAGFSTEMTDSGGFGPDGEPIDVPIHPRHLFVEWVKGRYGLVGWDEIKDFLLVEYTFDLHRFQPDPLRTP